MACRLMVLGLGFRVLGFGFRVLSSPPNIKRPYPPPLILNTVKINLIHHNGKFGILGGGWAGLILGGGD